MANATIEPNVPHVYTGMAAILNTLGVAKNGTLPTNMGGKPYIAAVDVAQEVKLLLVANQLIVLPEERVTKHEVIQANSRLSVAVGIEATYTFVSLVDGSTASISGVGDGLANGNAVASNIASTNAMKNALLRAFMITEQSVEDYSKNGVDESVPAQPKAVAQANNGTTRPVAPKADDPVKSLQAEIRKIAGGTGIDYASIGNTMFPKQAWSNNTTALKKVKEAVEKAVATGEVP